MEKYVAALMAIAVATASLFLAQQAVEPTSVAIEMEALTEAEAVVEVEAIVEAEAVMETEAVVEAEAFEETEAVAEAEAVEETEAVVEAETFEETIAVVETKAVAEAEAVVEAETFEETKAVVETEAVEETEAVDETEAAVEAEAEAPAESVEGDWPFAEIAPGSAMIFYGESYNEIGTVIVGAGDEAPGETPDAPAGGDGDVDETETYTADEGVMDEEPVEQGEQAWQAEPDAAESARADAPFDANQWASRFNDSWGMAASDAVAFEMLDGEEVGGYRDHITGWVDETIAVDVYESAEEGQLWTAVTVFEEDIPQDEESVYMDYFIDAILSCMRADGRKIDGQTAENFGHYIRGVVDAMRASGGEQALQEFTYDGMFFSIGYDEQGKIADCYIVY